MGGVPGQRGRACAARAGPPPGCSAPRAADHAAGARPATGELRPATWDEALDLVADRLAALRAEHGPDAVAVFGGGGLTNEKAYQLGKFARVALGHQPDRLQRPLVHVLGGVGGEPGLRGRPGLPFPLADIEQTDVVVLVGSNLAETMPPARGTSTRCASAAGRSWSVDPRRTPTADRADLLLQPVPGTDLALALGLLHLLVAGGHVDEEYVAARTTGFDGVRRSVAAWWPERVERVTGVAGRRAAGAGRRCSGRGRTGRWC